MVIVKTKQVSSESGSRLHRHKYITKNVKSKEGYILTSSVLLVFITISALFIALSYVNLLSSSNRYSNQSQSAHLAAMSGISGAITCLKKGNELPSILTPKSNCIGDHSNDFAGSGGSITTFNATIQGSNQLKTLTSIGKDNFGSHERSYSMKADITLANDTIVTSISSSLSNTGPHRFIVTNDGELYIYGHTREGRYSDVDRYKLLGRPVYNDNAVTKKVPQSYFGNVKIVNTFANVETFLW